MFLIGKSLVYVFHVFENSCPFNELHGYITEALAICYCPMLSSFDFTVNSDCKTNAAPTLFLKRV